MSTRSRGVTLVELVVFIIIVGVALAGLFAAFNTMTAESADPQVRKQVLAIAESLMDEVALMPFTYCDPDDANAATATSATVRTLPVDPTKCDATAEVAATATTDPATKESGEDRYGATPFDNVNDYHGFSMSGIKGISDGTTVIAGLSAYSASITVTQASLASSVPADAAIPADAVLLIRVTATGPNGATVTLEGFRTRYAPNTLP